MMRRMKSFAGVVSCLSSIALCWACEAEPSQDSGTSSGTDTGTAEAGETEGTPDDGHGTVRIQVSPRAGDATIFDGTTHVVATVSYDSCLQDFYLQTNPTMQQQGPDGAPVFASWQAQLCSAFPNVPSCTVADIEQTLLENNDVYTLRVTYAIDDPTTIADREFHVGPLPTETLAACGGGLRPTVELRQSGLFGRDGGGNQVWRIDVLPAQNSAIADQGVALRVEVESTSP